MTKSIEKNDVIINRLFNWGSKFEIKNSSDEVVFTSYIRIIGDADINRARVFALRKSAELRRKLKTEDSDERVAYLPEIEALDKENLVSICLTLTMKEIGDSVRKDLSIPYPKEPSSDSSLEEFEKFQQEVDNWPNLVEKEVESKMDKAIEKEKKVLEKLSFEDLRKHYEKLTVDRLCENEMYQRFMDACVTFGTFKDENYKEKMFESISEFDDLPTQIKEQFINFYSTLNIDMDELKK